MRVSEQSLFIFKVHCQKKKWKQTKKTGKSQQNHQKKKQQQKKKEGFIEWAAQNGKK